MERQLPIASYLAPYRASQRLATAARIKNSASIGAQHHCFGEDAYLKIVDLTLDKVLFQQGVDDLCSVPNDTIRAKFYKIWSQQAVQYVAIKTSFALKQTYFQRVNG